MHWYLRRLKIIVVNRKYYTQYSQHFRTLHCAHLNVEREYIPRLCLKIIDRKITSSLDLLVRESRLSFDFSKVQSTHLIATNCHQLLNHLPDHMQAYQTI